MARRESTVVKFDLSPESRKEKSMLDIVSQHAVKAGVENFFVFNETNTIKSQLKQQFGLFKNERESEATQRRESNRENSNDSPNKHNSFILSSDLMSFGPILTRLNGEGDLDLQIGKSEKQGPPS